MIDWSIDQSIDVRTYIQGPPTNKEGGRMVYLSTWENYFLVRHPSEFKPGVQERKNRVTNNSYISYGVIAYFHWTRIAWILSLYSLGCPHTTMIKYPLHFGLLQSKGRGKGLGIRVQTIYQADSNMLWMNGTWRIPCRWNIYIKHVCTWITWQTTAIHTRTLSRSNVDSFKGNWHIGRPCGHVDTQRNWLIPLCHSVGSLVKPNLHSYMDDRE